MYAINFKKKNLGDYILQLLHSQDFSENITSSSDLDVKVTGTQNGLRFLVDGVEFQSPMSHWSRVIQFKNSGVHAVRPPGGMTTIPHQPFMTDEEDGRSSTNWEIGIYTTTKQKSVCRLGTSHLINFDTSSNFDVCRL